MSNLLKRNDIYWAVLIKDGKTQQDIEAKFTGGFGGGYLLGVRKSKASALELAKHEANIWGNDEDNDGFLLWGQLPQETFEAINDPAVGVKKARSRPFPDPDFDEEDDEDFIIGYVVDVEFTNGDSISVAYYAEATVIPSEGDDDENQEAVGSVVKEGE